MKLEMARAIILIVALIAAFALSQYFADIIGGQR